MAEHLLHLPKIGAAGQQMRGKAVPQRVRTDFRRGAHARAYRFSSSQIRSRRKRRPRYDSSTHSAAGATGRPAAVARVPDRRAWPPPPGRSTAPPAPCLPCRGRCKTFVEVHVPQPEVGKLRRPAAGGVEQFQQRPVATPTGIGPAGSGEEPVDLLDAEHLGHALPQFLAAQQLRQVVAQHAFQLQVAEEDLQRDDVPGDAGGGQLAAVQPGRRSRPDRESTSSGMLRPASQSKKWARSRR